MQYRPEINGLRALAVVPIIFFHAGFTILSGGFIGVDIFFVISGYLITSILLRELQDSSFSFARFYERRARRILPALIVVMICTAPFARMWMLPLELRDFAISAASVALFASNILFWLQSGYFDTVSEFKPLLHTWSLAVEEQFYIVFPILLLLAWRHGRRASFLMIAIGAFLSLALCEYASRQAPSFNFYWAVTRAWELFAGSLCAFATIHPDTRRDNALSFIGLALIVASLVWFDTNTPFPSLYALLPVGGTCLVILFAHHGTRVAQLLSCKPLVGIGLISYSAYLWHQPLFALTRVRSLTDPPLWLMATLALAVFPLAWLTWRYVETPFRKGHKTKPISRRRWLLAAFALLLTLSGFGLAGQLTRGSISHLTAAELALTDSAAASPLRTKCHLIKDIPPAQDSCVYFGDHPSVAVLGNSHGVELAYGVATVLKEQDQALIHLTISGCGPSLGHATDNHCDRFYEDRLRFLQNEDTIKHVILAFRAENYGPAGAAAMVGMANQLSMAGKTVVLVLQAPTLAHDISIDIRGAIHKKATTMPGRPRPEWRSINATVYREISRLDPRVHVLDLADLFCTDATCYAVRDGIALYSDNNHISQAAAHLAAPRIATFLK